jgi:hypothetical protein
MPSAMFVPICHLNGVKSEKTGTFVSIPQSSVHLADRMSNFSFRDSILEYINRGVARVGQMVLPSGAAKWKNNEYFK